ncbi:MAG TPA: hypothetical protein VEQ66_15250 [Propionibacteriaceae bacterium]|nr:hypothetical protein [Propionibacteriaceae bacterium]
MFIQLVLGRIDNAEAAREALDLWVSGVVPGATDYLGSTTGVTEDGTLISIARYQSAEASHANGRRPEFKQWWSHTAQLFTAPPTVREADDVFTNVVGDPDDAGFVQVMQGHLSNPTRARELMELHVDKLNSLRPDILGRLAAQHPGGDYTQVVYFTSEEAARKAEEPAAPAELIPVMQEMMTITGRPDYYDLKEPWLTSP